VQFRAGSLGKGGFVKEERLDQHKQRDTSGAPRARCIAKLDRIQIVADTRRSHGLPEVNDFRTVRDTFVRQQTTARTYLRCRQLVNDKSGTWVYWQYAPQHAWLRDWKVTFIANDLEGLMPWDLLPVLKHCPGYCLVLIEIAFDFSPSTGVDAAFIKRHALFGKSRPRPDRGDGVLRYGSRHSDTLVRAYDKQAVRSFRAEVELHSSLLRSKQICKLKDIPRSAQLIVPSHFRMVVIHWQSVRRYLIERYRKAGTRAVDRAKTQAASIHAALGYLRSKQANNVHRFLQPIRENNLVREAAETWAIAFTGGGL
jgi:hypothetical protein